MCTVKPKTCVTCFITVIVLLRWSGNKPVVSQKYAYEHTPALRCYRSYAGHGYKVQWAFTRDGIRLHLVLTDWTSLGEAELWILKQEYNLPHEYGAVTLKKKAGRWVIFQIIYKFGMKKYIYICSYWIWWTDLFHHFSVYHTFVGYILLSKENWLGPIAGAENRFD